MAKIVAKLLVKALVRFTYSFTSSRKVTLFSLSASSATSSGLATIGVVMVVPKSSARSAAYDRVSLAYASRASTVLPYWRRSSCSSSHSNTCLPMPSVLPLNAVRLQVVAACCCPLALVPLSVGCRYFCAGGFPRLVRQIWRCGHLPRSHS